MMKDEDLMQLLNLLNQYFKENEDSNLFDDLFSSYKNLSDNPGFIMIELDGNDFKDKFPLEKEKKSTPKKKEKEKEIETKYVMRPSDMVRELDKTVIGHPDAKKHLAVVLFKYLSERNNLNKLNKMGKKMTKSNILISGLSGSGKTYMVEQLCKLLKLDYIIVDCASLTAPGYIGGNIDEEIERLYNLCEGNKERINRSVVILDEIGKLRPSKENNGKADVGGEACTKALLKILEGSEVKVGSGYKKDYVNTENILFIGTDTFMYGSNNIEDVVRERMDKKGRKRAVGFFGESEFEKEVINDRNEIRKNITLDDLIELGFSAELVGRFSTIINLDILTKEDYIKIAKLEKNGFSEYETLFKLYGKSLKINEDIYESLAEYMMNCETNSRALKGIVDRVMTPIVYNMMDSKKKRYTITKELVDECIAKTPKKEKKENQK